MGTGAAEPRPFRVEVPDEVLTDLHERLDRVRWADQIPGSTWEYGTDSTYLRDLVAYWRHGYDWRAQEAGINELDHFTLPLAGIDVHFVHAAGVGPDPLPLLLCHGWPGSFWEFHRILPLLTDPGRHGGDPADAFTVVAPSLPGYGFSFGSGQRRFDIGTIAEVLGDLMSEVLGYDRYAAQGGDWGGGIVSRLGVDRHGTTTPARTSCRSGRKTSRSHETDCTFTGYGAGTGFFDPGQAHHPHIHTLRNPSSTESAEVMITDIRGGDLRPTVVADPQPEPCFS